ncbi:unnamed protein product [Amoebophrya sp. A25]|nr:unnamed protein product [Amoebophrya sp. A25]|eukprot:GSA25T00020282001.1
MDDTHDYAKLIKRGQPDFIEIKGVTYNGDGPGKDKMTMKSVPWHPEVVAFGKSILEYEGLSDDYELACEHEHSLIILLARKSFYDKEKHEWRTHIDYSRYIELVESGEWRTKTSLDYACSTPSWALSGSPEKGFDPKDTRVYRKKKDKSAAVGDLAEGTSANTGAAGGA